MNPGEYRTLMLEPQWHPIRWMKRHGWIKEHLPEIVCYLFIWDLLVPSLISVVPPSPLRMVLWPWWRWTIFGLGVAPFAFVILVCLGATLYHITENFCRILKGFGPVLQWVYHNPPFRVTTRYRSH